MENKEFLDFYKKISIYNLIVTVISSSIILAFNRNRIGLLSIGLLIIIKGILWFVSNKSINLDQRTENPILLLQLSFITIYFVLDVFLFNNFIAVSMCFVIPIFIIALTKNSRIIKLESIVIIIFMILASTLSIWFSPLKDNFITNVIFYVFIFLQILLIIQKFIEETVSISAKTEYFMDKSKRDGMTGLYNSSTFYATVTDMVQLMAPFCILITQIDNFKKVTDQFGEPFGDYVVKTLAATIKKECRKQDVAFRYGNKDIAVILSNTTKDDAYVIAEKVRKNFSGKEYEHNKEWSMLRKPITISVGLIENNKRGASPQELIEKCDQALYYSIQHGKNQTTIYQEHIVEWEDNFDEFRKKYKEYER